MAVMNKNEKLVDDINGLITYLLKNGWDKKLEKISAKKTGVGRIFYNIVAPLNKDELKGKTIAELEDELIKSQDAKSIFIFARFVKGANVTKLEDAIIEINDPKYIWYMAANAHLIKGLNLAKLEDALIALEDEHYISELIDVYKDSKVKGDINKLNKALKEIKEKHTVQQ